MTIPGPAALAALVVIVGCGGSKEPEAPPAPTEPPVTLAPPPTAEPPAVTAPPPEPAARPEPGSGATFVLRREGAHGGLVEARAKVTAPDARFDPKEPSAARIVLALDLATLTTGDAARDALVKGPDFLAAAAHAQATATLSGLRAGATADAYDAALSLELRGVTKEVPAALRVVAWRPDGSFTIEVGAAGLARADWRLADPPELALDPTFDLSLRVDLGPLPVTPAKGTPEELYARMARHQDAVLDLIEAKKDDPEAAAQAVEQYAATHRADLASVATALNRLTPGQIDALLQTNEVELKRVMERGARVLGDNPSLQQSERFRRAMDALGAAGGP